MVVGHQLLTADALAELSSGHTVDISKFVQRFVCSQMQHALFYAAEGKKIFEHCSKSSGDEPVQNSHGDMNQLSRAGGGFSSPVLKPRNPCATEASVELLTYDTGHARVSTSKRKRDGGSAGPDDEKSRKLKKSQTEQSNNRRHQTDGQTCPPSKKKICKLTAKNKKMDAYSDDEVKERLVQRRARRRQKKDIIDRRLDSETSLSCTDSDDKGVRKTRTWNKKNRSRKKEPKNKLPAGLALMHGFSAKNIAKHRLTIGTSTATGVFGKGKASDRSEVPCKKGSLSRESFNETLFLHKGFQAKDKPPTTRRKKKKSPRSSNSASVAGTSASSSGDNDFEKPSISEITGISNSSTISQDRKSSGIVEKSAEQSVIWDIEREFLSEAPQEMQTGPGSESLIVDTKACGWAVPSPSDVGSPGSRTRSLVCGDVSTLAPSHSASQTMMRNLIADTPQPQTSRYFTIRRPDVPMENTAGLATACKPAGRPTSRESQGYTDFMNEKARNIELSSELPRSDTHPYDELHQVRVNCESTSEKTNDRRLCVEQSLKSDLADGITVLYDACVADDPNTYNLDCMQGIACDNAFFDSHLSTCDISLEYEDCPYLADELEPSAGNIHDDLGELNLNRDASVDDIYTSREQLEDGYDNAYVFISGSETNQSLDLDYYLDTSHEEPAEADNTLADFNAPSTSAMSVSDDYACNDSSIYGGDDLLEERQDHVFTSDCEMSHYGGNSNRDTMTSTANSSTPSSVIEFAMHLAPFSQGRSLLLGIEDVSITRPQPPYETCQTTLENVETMVANGIRDHWHPMRL